MAHYWLKQWSYFGEHSSFQDLTASVCAPTAGQRNPRHHVYLNIASIYIGLPRFITGVTTVSITGTLVRLGRCCACGR